MLSRLKNRYPKAKILSYQPETIKRGEKPYISQVLQAPLRQYVIDKIKKPLMKAITVLVQRFPEPTRENCFQKNTFKLFNIRDKFFEYEGNPTRREFFEAMWKLLIAEYEHDPYYRYRLDWMIEGIIKSDWQPRKIREEQHWNEPMEE